LELFLFYLYLLVYGDKIIEIIKSHSKILLYLVILLIVIVAAVFIIDYAYFPKPPEDQLVVAISPFYLIDEYVRWGFPRDHGESFHFDGSPMPHIIAYALIMYVVDTPDGRPEKQVEFAKELKNRITEGLPNMSEEAQTRWDTAVKFYKDGGLKPIVINYQL